MRRLKLEIEIENNAMKEQEHVVGRSGNRGETDPGRPGGAQRLATPTPAAERQKES